MTFIINAVWPSMGMDRPSSQSEALALIAARVRRDASILEAKGIGKKGRDFLLGMSEIEPPEKPQKIMGVSLENVIQHLDLLDGRTRDVMQMITSGTSVADVAQHYSVSAKRIRQIVKTAITTIAVKVFAGQ